MLEILIVCTANQCRSPMAEGILRRRLEERDVPAAISSAGLMDGGHAATALAIATMDEVGIDIAGHRSRQITLDLLAEADLTVTMTRQHLIDLLTFDPDSWPRVFQLGELVLRAEAAGRRRPDQPWASWLAAVGSGRTRSGLLSAQLGDDIADPIGGPPAGYRRTRDLLDDLLGRLATLLG